jgi:hypothetical protein
VKAIDGKVFAIDGEDFADAFPLRNAYQSRIGHIHGVVGILAHQLSHAGNIRGIKRQKLERASL